MQSKLPLKQIVEAFSQYSTPFYLYDEQKIIDNCQQFQKITSPFGIILNYAMKANSNLEILKTITKQGFGIDASSINEVIRANKFAQVPLEKIELTSQEVHSDQSLEILQNLIKNGLQYTACSIQQLKSVAKFLSSNKKHVSLRIHPGDTGSGESVTRNTANKYSCFGIQLNQELKTASEILKENQLTVERIHIHIGSGSDPQKWKEHVVRALNILNEFFPTATILNLGGGYKIARVPHEKQVNLEELGSFMSSEVQKFFEKTGRKIKIQMEPGTFIVANSGYIVTKIIDKKYTGSNDKEGFKFLVLNGGMEVNIRPELYGSQHPFYVISNESKKVISDEFQVPLKQKDEKLNQEMQKHNYIVVGKCCESGDSQTISRDQGEEIITRTLEADPQINDIFVIGGAGAYCSTMTPFNYNSHLQSAELLIRTDEKLQVIRKQQTLEQIVENELSLQK